MIEPRHRSRVARLPICPRRPPFPSRQKKEFLIALRISKLQDSAFKWVTVFHLNRLQSLARDTGIETVAVSPLVFKVVYRQNTLLGILIFLVTCRPRAARGLFEGLAAMLATIQVSDELRALTARSIDHVEQAFDLFFAAAGRCPKQSVFSVPAFVKRSRSSHGRPRRSDPRTVELTGNRTVFSSCSVQDRHRMAFI